MTRPWLTATRDFFAWMHAQGWRRRCILLSGRRLSVPGWLDRPDRPTHNDNVTAAASPLRGAGKWPPECWR